MSGRKPENRLTIHWDITGKRLELSAAGAVGVIALGAAIVIGIAILVRML